MFSFSVRRRPLPALMGAAVLFLPVGQTVALAQPPAKSLEARGLTRIGKVWCIADEVTLRDKLTELDRLAKRFHEAQQKVEQLLTQNQEAAANLPQFTKLEKSIHDQMAAAKPGTPQYKQLDGELKKAAFALEQLRGIYSPPDKLGAAAPLKPALVELANARAELTIRYLALQNTPNISTQQYDRLRQDESIMHALAELKDDQLGPAKQIQDKRKAIERIEPEILNDSLPVYREGAAYRLTAVLDDRQPLTFGIGGASDPTIIPQNIAEAVGIAATETSPRLKLRVAANRDETVQEVKLAKLRFGRNVVSNVTAYILPPEAADLGARIGAKALPGYRVKINAERLQLVIEGVK
jgi:hypothetical protein